MKTSTNALKSSILLLFMGISLFAQYYATEVNAAYLSGYGYNPYYSSAYTPTTVGSYQDEPYYPGGMFFGNNPYNSTAYVPASGNYCYYEQALPEGKVFGNLPMKDGKIDMKALEEESRLYDCYRKCKSELVDRSLAAIEERRSINSASSYRVCGSCGGSGSCRACRGIGSSSNYGVSVSCGACHGSGRCSSCR